MKPRPASVPAAPSPATGTEAPRAATKTFTGRWRWIGTDGLVHPGYGWRVITSYLSGNKWVKADERWINLGNGAFSVSAVIPGGNPARFTFTTANRYFTPVHISAGYTYQWNFHHKLDRPIFIV